MKHKFKIITVFTLVLVGLLIYYLFPKEIDKSFEGIAYRIGSENRNYEEKVSIRVKGALIHNLFGEKSFKGAITIEGPDEFLKFNGKDLNVGFVGANNGGILFNFYKSSDPSYGALYINGMFDQLIIRVSEDGDNTDKVWNPENELMIAAPATNRDEAVQITNQIFTGEFAIETN